jgi:hypothetical protein
MGYFMKIDAFNAKNFRKIWKQLRDSHVPIVSAEDYLEVEDFEAELLGSFATNSYTPGVGHGYLGFPKRNGCTRFVPILSKEDMAVYYSLALTIQPHLAHDFPNVFGGWQSVPKKISDSKKQYEEEISDLYYSETMSQQFWFKNWKNFTSLLRDTISANDPETFVVATDIANFYDTIDISRLIRLVRSKCEGLEDVVDLLEYFLSFWDRRIKGYKPSSKGLPQEIIGDASRLLSHAYLEEFDKSFTSYCTENDMVFIRWADDMIVFGKGIDQLELAIHKASKMLLSIGLNLNASKTQIYTVKEYGKYRGLSVLDAVENNDVARFNHRLRRFILHSKKAPARVDTVFRAAIGFMRRHPKARTAENIKYLKSELKKYDQASALTFAQINSVVEILGPQSLSSISKTIAEKPYAAPKAQFIKTLWKYDVQLKKNGVSKQRLNAILKRLKASSEDSEVISEICLPAYHSRVGKV